MIKWSRIVHGVEFMASIPKSFYASWRLTSFKRAFKLPVRCRYNVKLLNLCGIMTGGGIFKIGFNRTGIYDLRHQRSMLNVEGKMVVDGKVGIGTGARIDVNKGGVLHFDGQVGNSAGVTIVCADHIVIGDHTALSWDTLIIDKDYHYVLDINTGKTKVNHKPIVIGKNAWLCAGSKVLKGSVLPDGCILSAGSVLNKTFDEHNCLLQGNPASVVKHGVTRSNVEIK